MKIIVFGGAGYLGTELITFLSQYDNEVILYDNLKQISNLSAIKYGLLRFINDDVANVSRYPEIFEGVDRIYYLNSPRLNELTNEYQVLHELHILEGVLEFAKNLGIKFYFTSSCSVYGVNKEVVNEKSPTMVTSLYSKLKIESENIIQDTLTDYTIFRLSTLFGHSRNIREDVFINDMVYRAKNREPISIFDPNAKRPHLHVVDAGDILASLVDKKTPNILNIGYNENNFTKKEVIGMIKKVANKEFKYVEETTNDSRSYEVNFDLLHTIIQYGQRPVLDGIKELYDLNHILCSVEEWDTIIDYYRPNCSSKTWYLEEEQKMQRPKMWGDWNIGEYADAKHSEINFAFTCGPTAPDLIYTPGYTLHDKKHLYMINVYDSTFFYHNRELGFKLIKKEYLEDVRRNKAAIVILHLHEGYSGNFEENNKDLLYIDRWIRQSKLPPQNVHYIHSNLLIKHLAQRRMHRVKCHSINYFISDFMGYNFSKEKIIDFKPIDEQYLALSYNRQTRAHRIKFAGKLYEKNLLNKCRVSLGKYDEKYLKLESEKEVARLSPIMFDVSKDMSVNWVDDLSVPDYEKTFISVISETLTYNDVIFFSEKTWKTIFVGHPFILIGNPYSLRELKNMGFKTYDKWIDESYDKEINLDKRLNMVVKEMEKFNQKPLSELIEIRKEMVSICEFNKKNLIEIVKRDYSYDGTLEGYRNHLSLTKILRGIYNKLQNTEIIENYEENLL